MNAFKRFTSWWMMFAHLMRELENGQWHIEVCRTKGPKICGIHIGVVFLDRYCHTCGYRP